MAIRQSATAGAAVAAAIALVTASAASAEPLDGSYTMTRSEPTPGSQEVILTPCGQDCVNWRYLGPGELPDGHNFHLHGSQWVMDTNSKFYFDKDTLKGSQGIEPGQNALGLPTVPFILTKNG